MRESGVGDGERATSSGRWHALTVEDALRELDTSAGGLSQAEAERRLARYGPNRLRPPQRRGPVLRFLAQFHNVLIYVLLAAAAITALLAHWVDTGVILGVVILNALIGFLQEGKAERALDAIRGMLSLHASVWRDGHRREVEAEELVPGDVVFLQSGDKVPADVRAAGEEPGGRGGGAHRRVGSGRKAGRAGRPRRRPRRPRRNGLLGHAGHLRAGQGHPLRIAAPLHGNAAPRP